MDIRTGPFNRFIKLLIILVTIFSCEKTSPSETNSVELVHLNRSNVTYDSSEFQKGHMHVPPYIANGVIGGCFDHMGFQSLPNKGIPNGRTVIGYVGHYYMHSPSTRQAQLPLAYIQAEFADGSSILNMMDIKDYKQELDIQKGVLTTSYDLFGPTTITTFAHQAIPGLMVMKINRKADHPNKTLILNIHCETSSTQQQNIGWPPQPVDLQFTMDENKVTIISSTNMVDTQWQLVSNQTISRKKNTLQIRCEQEETYIHFLIDRTDTNPQILEEQSYSSLLTSHTKAWKENWKRSWINFPDDKSNHIWNRANYYNLSNFPIVPEKALIPTGMNSNIWGFTFPQDVYYVAENLLRSGHFERYQKSMEYWLDILPEVKKYAPRIMEVEGGFYPWTPPFDQWDAFEKNGVVGNDSYEIHNPAYVAAMVWHYYLRTGDQVFLQKYFPILEEVWRFYTQVLHKNERSTFDVSHHKAAGQDEANKLESSKNLLCASYSAEYTMRNYIKACPIVDQFDSGLFQKAEEISAAGLERNTLLKSTGYYRSYEGDDRPPNSQKHPVQLNAIAFLPMSDLGYDAPSIKAWKIGMI